MSSKTSSLNMKWLLTLLTLLASTALATAAQPLAIDRQTEPPPIPSNAANLTPWTKSNFLAAHLPGAPGEGNR
jgi:hypothetical protein